MKKTDRLRKNFQRVLRQKVYSGGGLAVFAVPGTGKIGVVVGKGVKGAVKRNRVKRKLREFANRNVLRKTPKDVILMAYGETFNVEEKVKFG